MTTVTRRNRFNGESVELTAAEADKHDKIFYHEAMATLEDQKLGTGGSKHWKEMRKLLTWFQKIMRKLIWYCLTSSQAPKLSSLTGFKLEGIRFYRRKLC